LAVGNIPHRPGCAILCKALAKAGVRPETVQRLDAAFVAFDELVERHAGDRESFELVVGGLSRQQDQGQSLEQSRKLAFRGNSAVWSARARLQISTAVMAPSAEDPDMVDVIHISGLVDLRRLRPDVRWVLVRRQVFDDADENVRGEAGEPLEKIPGANGFTLIRRFSSDPFPDVIEEEQGDELHFVLPAGRVGRTGELTAIFGAYHRAIGSQRASDSDKYGQMIMKLFTPAEHLHFDMLVHEDLGWAMKPQVGLFGSLDGRSFHMGSGRQGVSLPFTESVVDLGLGIAGTATPRMPWYGEMLSWAFEQVGWDASAFRAFRFEMAYPPIPSFAIMYSELDSSPEGEEGS
jgi:hypothetical protein